MMPIPPVAAVSATAMSKLVIERCDYRFTADGLPVIELTVMNPDTATVQADLTVKINGAVQSAQDEYRYIAIGGGTTLRDVAFEPGKEERVIVRQVPLLKPGEYEAEIRLKQKKASKLRRLDFSLTAQAAAQAESERARSHASSTGAGSSHGSSWRAGAVVLFVCLLAVAFANLWRQPRSDKQRKRRGSRP